MYNGNHSRQQNNSHKYQKKHHPLVHATYKLDVQAVKGLLDGPATLATRWKACLKVSDQSMRQRSAHIPFLHDRKDNIAQITAMLEDDYEQSIGPLGIRLLKVASTGDSTDLALLFQDPLLTGISSKYRLLTSITEEDERSALHVAASKGHLNFILDSFRYLISIHDAFSYQENGPLSLPSQQLLSKFSKLLNSRDKQGRTPLMCAVRHGRNNVINGLLGKIKPDIGDESPTDRLLLDLLRTLRNESLSNADYKGRTPLMLAARRGSVRSVRNLLNSSDRQQLAKQLSAKDEAGHTALFVNLIRGRLSRRVIKDLLAHMDEEERTNQIVAIEDGYVLERLLNKGKVEIAEVLFDAGVGVSHSQLNTMGKASYYTLRSRDGRRDQGDTRRHEETRHSHRASTVVTVQFDTFSYSNERIVRSGSELHEEISRSRSSSTNRSSKFHRTKRPSSTAPNPNRP